MTILVAAQICLSG
jgi:WD40 repeat protein